MLSECLKIAIPPTKTAINQPNPHQSGVKQHNRQKNLLSQTRITQEKVIKVTSNKKAAIKQRSAKKSHHPRGQAQLSESKILNGQAKVPQTPKRPFTIKDLILRQAGNIHPSGQIAQPDQGVLQDQRQQHRVQKEH